MSVTNKRWDGQTITPKHDSIQFDNGQNGIIHGCEITHLGSNILRIAEGYMIICGRLIEVDQTDINCEVSSSGTLNGQMIIRLNLGAVQSIEILTEAAGELTELTQDADANYDNGIYEIQLATYNVNETTISNLEVTAPTIDKLGDKVAAVESDIDELNQNLNTKVSKFTSDNYVGVTGLAYDATNKKLGLKVEGADTVIPFSSIKKVSITGNTSSINRQCSGDWPHAETTNLYVEGEIASQTDIISGSSNMSSVGYGTRGSARRFKFKNAVTLTLNIKITASSNSNNSIYFRKNGSNLIGSGTNGYNATITASFSPSDYLELFICAGGNQSFSATFSAKES